MPFYADVWVVPDGRRVLVYLHLAGEIDRPLAFPRPMRPTVYQE